MVEHFPKILASEEKAMTTATITATTTAATTITILAKKVDRQVL